MSPDESSEPLPFREPWRTTALRTGLLAAAIGLVIGLLSRSMAAMAAGCLAALWFTLGGHFAELGFRNSVQLRLATGTSRRLLRMLYWFVAGSLLYVGAVATVTLVAGRNPGIRWWVAGVGFVGAELLIHLLMRARGEPSFYDGRG